MIVKNNIKYVLEQYQGNLSTPVIVYIVTKDNGIYIGHKAKDIAGGYDVTWCCKMEHQDKYDRHESIVSILKEVGKGNSTKVVYSGQKKSKQRDDAPDLLYNIEGSVHKHNREMYEQVILENFNREACARLDNAMLSMREHQLEERPRKKVRSKLKESEITELHGINSKLEAAGMMIDGRENLEIKIDF